MSTAELPYEDMAYVAAEADEGEVAQPHLRLVGTTALEGYTESGPVDDTAYARASDGMVYPNNGHSLSLNQIDFSAGVSNAERFPRVIGGPTRIDMSTLAARALAGYEERNGREYNEYLSDF